MNILEKVAGKGECVDVVILKFVTCLSELYLELYELRGGETL